LLLFLSSSIHQDVPLYSLDEFKRRAPEEARTGGVLSDEHQLMLNRLSFELAERQRCAISVYHMVILTNHVTQRLDLKKKELVQQKEELLKESKIKVTTMDNVKSQIDVLMKVECTTTCS
jgi:THO complex subunit 5